MSQEHADILVYITDNKDRIVSGDPLTLYIPDKEQRREIILQMTRALHADAVELINGDHLIIGD